MSNWQLKACYAIAAFFLVSVLPLPVASKSAAETDEFDLSIVDLKYDLAERISEFDFKILGGQIVGLPRVPIGWTISISNDPSWSSEISGKAIVGAAFMQPDEFINKIFLIKAIVMSPH
jgi:hypothetical protein